MENMIVLSQYRYTCHFTYDWHLLYLSHEHSISPRAVLWFQSPRMNNEIWLVFSTEVFDRGQATRALAGGIVNGRKCRFPAVSLMQRAERRLCWIGRIPPQSVLLHVTSAMSGPTFTWGDFDACMWVHTVSFYLNVVLSNKLIILENSSISPQ